MTTDTTSPARDGIDAFRDITVYRVIAQTTYLCAWSIGHRDGDHEWCPTVIEPGDEHIAVTDTTTIYRYCLGCGHQLYGLAPSTLSATTPPDHLDHLPRPPVDA
jgi:hypothetical protein